MIIFGTKASTLVLNWIFKTEVMAVWDKQINKYNCTIRVVY